MKTIALLSFAFASLAPFAAQAQCTARDRLTVVPALTASSDCNTNAPAATAGIMSHDIVFSGARLVPLLAAAASPVLPVLNVTAFSTVSTRNGTSGTAAGKVAWANSCPTAGCFLATLPTTTDSVMITVSGTDPATGAAATSTRFYGNFTGIGTAVTAAPVPAAPYYTHTVTTLSLATPMGLPALTQGLTNITNITIRVNIAFGHTAACARVAPQPYSGSYSAFMAFGNATCGVNAVSCAGCF